MTGTTNPRALVVYESFFGNTERIARAVVTGLRLEGMVAVIADVADGSGADVGPCDLVVVGGPTHAFALSRPSTREDAIRRGGNHRYAARGLREWLADLPVCDDTRLAAAFDTRVGKVRHLPLSAARSAARILRQRGYTLVGAPTGFVVQDVEGPLGQRETERAVSWARSLAREVQARCATAGRMERP